MRPIQKAVFKKVATDLGVYWTSPLSKAGIRHVTQGYATGRFKTASAPKMWFEKSAEVKQFLKSFDSASFFKAASLGGDQEQGFEQSFSSLAYAYLKDKSPRLLDFIVGFQLVDRNEDNTKAMGIFGFKVGDQWLYAPVFFLNGDLKGHELLYIKKQDRFVPMKENWVNYLISRKPHVLGEASPQNTHQLGGLMPQLTRFAHHPGSTTKQSSAMCTPHIDDWAKPFLPFVGAVATKKAAALYPEAKDPSRTLNLAAIVESPFKAACAATADRLNMHTFLGENFDLLKAAFDKAYMAYPLIKKGFDQFYGNDFFSKMTKEALDEAAKVHSNIMQVKTAKSYVLPPKKKLTNSLIDEPEIEDPIKSGALQILFRSDYLKQAAEKAKNKVDEEATGGIKVNLPELDDEEREKLLKDTVLIKDKRDSSKVSMAYNTQVKLEMANPSETGLYHVLEKPGSFDEMVVIHSPHTGRGREPFAVVLRKSSPRNWMNTHPTNLWTKQNDVPSRADFTKYVDGLDGISSLEKGGTYVAISASGSGTCPFRVKEVYGDGAYRVDWQDHCRYNQRRPDGLPPLKDSFSDDYRSGYSSWDSKIWVNKRKGTGLKSVNGELSIPEGYKIIKVSDPPKPKKKDDSDPCSIMPCNVGESSADADDNKSLPIQPGNLVDVQTLVNTKQASLQLHDTGNEVWFKGKYCPDKPLTKLAALVSLVKDHGLREQQAREMLKAAAAAGAHHRAVTYHIKYAYPIDSSLQGGPNAPSFPEPWTGTEQNGYNSVASIYPQEEYQPIDEMSSQNTDPSIYDPFFEPDQNAMQVAQQAANSGQKEVFDVSMIGGMLKAVRQDSLVDRYLGDLMKALDKLGRILFMFYWHQEEFEDRYGQQDLPELEDSLRNSFEMLGDVTLFLMEKSVKGGAGIEFGMGGSNAEPSVEEAARN